MQTLKSRPILLAVAFVAACFLLINAFWSPRQTVDFSTQVKPILNKNCITCHGGVKKKANFSLMTREDALSPTESGKPAIVVGKPNESEFYKRLTHPNAEERMPYKEAPLSKDEIKILHDWIAEGANWGNHWAYNSIELPKVPRPTWLFGLFEKNIDWAKAELDYFIFDKLKSQNLTPSVSADKNTLLRRVSLDIIGMPASESLQKQFLADNSPKAYENLVDSLLASPHYGEKWAAMWLDLARYADTKGYERDDARGGIWRYRDWLIRSFNTDMPYNQFITEQLAGDLLENPTDAQLIATGFHRNTMTNDEGGTDNEEFRTAAVIDRVNTTWETLMGTTFACTQCHGHPYEPIRHHEYYQFMAFFNNTLDHDTYEDYPQLRFFRGNDSLNFLNLKNWFAQNVSITEGSKWTKFVRTWQPVRYSLETDSFKNAELYDTKWLGMRQNGFARLKNVNLDGKTKMFMRYKSGLPKGVLSIFTEGGVLLKKINVDTNGKNKIRLFDLPPTAGTHDLFLTYSNPNLKKPTDVGINFDWFHFTTDLPFAEKPNGAEMEQIFWQLLTSDSTKNVPIVMENPTEMQRPTHVFERGNWLVKAEKVAPKTPSVFPQTIGNQQLNNRLGLAKWMTDKRHPLTSRVMVNRVWEQLFGAGLVETLEDFGSQGFAPTHPELLDFLAYNFMHNQNWSLKKLLKSIVMSATYQQDSKVTPQYLAADPTNKWLGHGARIRLSAEQIRDQSLQVSGILSEKMYGESVMPYQPNGVWQSPWNGKTWQQSKGVDQYRRAIYTYWKRSAPYPAAMTFDGVAREICSSRRIRTNTPLQALASLNDSAQVEAARFLAFKIKKDNQNLVLNNCLSILYEKAIGKPLPETTRTALAKLYENAVTDFKKNPIEAMAMNGKERQDSSAENAALVVVANAVFNLDVFVVKN